MFLIKRGSETLANTGQPFRDYLESGYRNERATFGDWKLHLNTLFPEVRLKNTIEARCADSQKLALSTAVPALWVGLFYDDTALARAEDLAREIDLDALFASRSALVTRGLDASIGAAPVRPLAERLLQIAADGLDRRALLDSNGKTERVHLEPLIALTSRGRTPADELLDGLTGYGPFGVGELVKRTGALR
jgi:glutamate--cysteine ligase